MLVSIAALILSLIQVQVSHVHGFATSSSIARRRPTTRLHIKSNKKKLDRPSSRTQSPELPTLTQVDVIFGSRTSLVYDPGSERFLPQDMIREELAAISSSSSFSIVNSPPLQACRKVMAYHIKPYLSAAFLPAGVTPAYYQYARWRVYQRLINANLQVFGTQSLLLALGIKTKSLALSAALNWILKDALGKITRMVWASKMGGKFDSDAKRWRFRASLLYAAGNGMEITTYCFPHLFLLFATAGNCCKQMSMLTCSATRTALYNSFRDGTRENIGDITAKGEASIAVVDLIGIATGVTASHVLGTSVKTVLAMYGLLQSMEIFCIYRMMRTVQFRVLNFERLEQALQDFIGSADAAINGAIGSVAKSVANAQVISGSNDSTGGAPAPESATPTTKTPPITTTTLKTPEEMAQTEKILQPPSRLSRRAFAFGSLGRAKLSPEELSQLLRIFSYEKFILVVGKNRKLSKKFRLARFLYRHTFRHFYGEEDPALKVQENCHIVLHAEATNADIVKSSLALLLLRQKLAHANFTDPDEIRSRDCFDLIQVSCQEADRLLPRLLRQLANKGWTSPARFMFGRVTMRAEWPLQARHTKNSTEAFAQVTAAPTKSDE